jgi:hypothetical protein
MLSAGALLGVLAFLIYWFVVRSEPAPPAPAHAQVPALSAPSTVPPCPSSPT